MSVVVSDVAELKEAIERFVVQAVADAVQVPNGGAAALSPDEQAVVVAARRWVRMVEGLDYEAAARALYEHEGHGMDFDKLAAEMLEEDGLDLLADYVAAVTPIVDAAVGVEKETL